jgi:hypothetical protein
LNTHSWELSQTVHPDVLAMHGELFYWAFSYLGFGFFICVLDPFFFGARLFGRILTTLNMLGAWKVE